jgi:serine/threonine protein kinase
MHQRRVVHRDLKHDNILLTSNGEVRICDFGWSAEVQLEKALLTTCGTPHIWAPEIWEGQPQGFGVDLWSLGNLVYELLVGHQPFWGTMEELRFKVLSVDLRYPPDLLSQAAINLFYCFLQRDQRCRIPAWQLIREHPWILPAVAELAKVGLTAEPLPHEEPLPIAQATVEHVHWCVPYSAPIAMRADAEGPASFVIPVVPESSLEPAGQSTAEGGVPPQMLQGPARSTAAETNEVAASSHDSSGRIPFASADLTREAGQLDPASELLLEEDMAALAINSDVPACTAASKEPDHQAEADVSGASSQDSILGGA